MKASIQKLHKFFKLEAEQGYENRAVIGGLDRMLSPWEAEARLENLTEEIIQAVAARLRDYPRLSPASRSEALLGLWNRIQRETGETLPPLSPLDPRRGEPTGESESAAARPSQPSRQPSAPRITRPRPSPVAASASQPAPDGPSAALNAPVTVLAGIGARHGQTLARLKLNTLGDMLYFFPRRYDDYSRLKPINRLWYGEEVTVIASVDSLARRIIRGSRQIVEAVVSDGSGAMRVVWWNPYIARQIRPGMQVALSGKIEQYLGRLMMSNPEVEPLEQQNLSTNRVVPVYPLTANITQRWLRKQMYQVVSYWAPRVRDYMPASVRQEAGLMPLPQALLQAHFPDSLDTIQAARLRLAFDEIFLLQLGVMRQKRQWQDRAARTFTVSDDWLARQVASLPFTLTEAQQRALADLRADLSSARPMNRLLQGDVGSGKTVIAALGMAMVIQGGAQAALMAPTSILAEQHYRSLTRLLTSEAPSLAEDPLGPQPLLRPAEIRLLVGATSESEKEDIRRGLADGSIKLIIGTHALIEAPVVFADLQFAVVDEQHRFGVEQRAALRAKGRAASDGTSSDAGLHLLVMTATPIPRSLALTVYGDLDLSLMDELPPGRQPVETQVFYPRERERTYALIRAQVKQGRQAFIIYPLVEERENTAPDEASGEKTPRPLSAVEEHARLRQAVFPDLKLGLLHGRMKPEEKDAVMAAFRDGQLHILVSTSVVEVGVDVPNASVMLIEGANRFGLAQLHQFRGRVGRGADQAYCILIPETPDQTENDRLSAMVETNNGFVLAERDLDQRGPGDFLGTRQAGFSELRMASLTDIHLIEQARRQASALFALDPDLTLPEHLPLAAAMRRFWSEQSSASENQGDIS